MELTYHFKSGSSGSRVVADSSTVKKEGGVLVGPMLFFLVVVEKCLLPLLPTTDFGYFTTQNGLTATKMSSGSRKLPTTLLPNEGTIESDLLPLLPRRVI